MRKFGIVTLILCSLLVVYFVFIGFTNGKRNFEVSLIPISFLILQAVLAGYYVQTQSRNHFTEKDVIMDEPTVVSPKIPLFYKISAILLSLIALLAMTNLGYFL